MAVAIKFCPCVRFRSLAFAFFIIPLLADSRAGYAYLQLHHILLRSGLAAVTGVLVLQATYRRRLRRLACVAHLNC